MANVIVGMQGVSGVKAAMDHICRAGGRPLLPLLALTDAERAAMI
jgi:hypothetical protein